MLHQIPGSEKKNNAITATQATMPRQLPSNLRGDERGVTDGRESERASRS